MNKAQNAEATKVAPFLIAVCAMLANAVKASAPSWVLEQWDTFLAITAGRRMRSARLFVGSTANSSAWPLTRLCASLTLLERVLTSGFKVRASPCRIVLLSQGSTVWGRHSAQCHILFPNRWHLVWKLYMGRAQALQADSAF